MHWLATELSAEEIARAADASVFPSESLRKFLTWQLYGGAFDFAIIAKRGKSWLNEIFPGNLACWPQVQVILDVDDAKNNLKTLERAGRRGFELLIASTTSQEEAIHFFSQFGYQLAGSSKCASGGEHDPLVVAPDGALLERGLMLATRMQATFLCCFAHDADPVYLLSRQ